MPCPSSFSDSQEGHINWSDEDHLSRRSYHEVHYDHSRNQNGAGLMTQSRLHYVLLTGIRLSQKMLVDFAWMFKDIGELKIYHESPEQTPSVVLCGFRYLKSATSFQLAANRIGMTSQLFPSSVYQVDWEPKLNLFGLLSFGRKLWFHPDLQLGAMERLLRNCAPGAFVVGCGRPNGFTVAVKTEKGKWPHRFHNFPIVINEDGTYSSHSHKVKFASLEHLLVNMMIGNSEVPVGMWFPLRLTRCRYVMDVDDLAKDVEKFWREVADDYQKNREVLSAV